MNSMPLTALSAGMNEFPMVFWICAESSRVTVAGASVIFSTRRDADTTIPPSSTALGSRATDTIGMLVSETDTPATSLGRSEEHTSELQSHSDLVCRLLLEKKKKCTWMIV